MKLLVVDDDGLIRDSLKMMLELEPDWTAHTAKDGNEAIHLCEKEHPDVVLMDIRMPDCDGVEATRIIKEKMPDIKIVMLTTFTDDGYIASAIEAGAEGYLLKSTPADGIIERIRAVEKGAMVFDKGVRISAKKTTETSFDELTERENEILSLIAKGLSNSEIASQLFLSQGTVRNAISVILEKLDLRDRTQLAIHYWKNA